jgi:hypothetical protein
VGTPKVVTLQVKSNIDRKTHVRSRLWTLTHTHSNGIQMRWKKKGKNDNDDVKVKILDGRVSFTDEQGEESRQGWGGQDQLRTRPDLMR